MFKFNLRDFLYSPLEIGNDLNREIVQIDLQTKFGTLLRIDDQGYETTSRNGTIINVIYSTKETREIDKRIKRKLDNRETVCLYEKFESYVVFNTLTTIKKKLRQEFALDENIVRLLLEKDPKTKDRGFFALSEQKIQGLKRSPRLFYRKI